MAHQIWMKLNIAGFLTIIIVFIYFVHCCGLFNTDACILLFIFTSKAFLIYLCKKLVYFKMVLCFFCVYMYLFLFYFSFNSKLNNIKIQLFVCYLDRHFVYFFFFNSVLPSPFEFCTVKYVCDTNLITYSN